MSESVAIVTGASQEIGRASAIRLARDFSAVVLVARNLQHLNDTAAQVKAARAEPLALDLDLRPCIGANCRRPDTGAFRQDRRSTQHSRGSSAD
jgi:NADP-dependent 3-hydroxy acid dehydrogenase YdfG